MSKESTPAKGGPAANQYEVGYKRPPKHSQFKPKKSGNPKGRQPGARSIRADLNDELRQEVAVSENGKTTMLRKQVLAVKALVNKAAKGDPRALSLLFDWINRLESGEQDSAVAAPVSDQDEAILQDFLRRHGGASGLTSDG